MKASRPVFLMLLLVAAGGAITWYRTLPTIPVRRTLASAEGKTIDARIVGKTGGVLHLDRVADGMRFELPESKLSWGDRWFAWRLPEQPPPPRPEAEEENPADSYITTRLLRIEDLRRKRTEFIAEIESGSLSGILTRKRQEDVIGMDREIAELEAAITAHRVRFRPLPAAPASPPTSARDRRGGG